MINPLLLQYASPTCLFSRKLPVLLLLLVIPFLMPLATRGTLPGIPAQQTDWTLDTSAGGVEFYHAIVTCHGRKAVFLRLVNKNSFKVNISWKEVFTTQAPQPVEGYAGRKQLVADPGDIAETDCDHPTRKELLILSTQVSPAYNADISKFEYKDITVSKAN